MNEMRRQVHQLKRHQVRDVRLDSPQGDWGLNLDLFLVTVGHTIDPSGEGGGGLVVGRTHLPIPLSGKTNPIPALITIASRRQATDKGSGKSQTNIKPGPMTC